MLLICFVTDCGTADTTQNITTQSLRLFLFWCQRPASRLPQVFFEAFPQNEPFRLTFPTHSYLVHSASYSCPGVAQYWLSFYGNWSAATHPILFQVLQQMASFRLWSVPRTKIPTQCGMRECWPLQE